MGFIAGKSSTSLMSEIQPSVRCAHKVVLIRHTCRIRQKHDQPVNSHTPSPRGWQPVFEPIHVNVGFSYCPVGQIPRGGHSRIDESLVNALCFIITGSFLPRLRRTKKIDEQLYWISSLQIMSAPVLRSDLVAQRDRSTLCKHCRTPSRT